MLDKFVILVGVFHINRITEFFKSFYDNPPGVDYDIYFIHNCYEVDNVVNTYTRTNEEIDLINKFLLEQKELHPEINIVNRANIGRDMGALWHGYNLVKGNYKYYFFINERVRIKIPNWLKLFQDAYGEDPKLGALTPQLCGGHKYPWCLRCLFWSQTNESIKDMDWWEPRNRQDAHIQEMEMVYPHVSKLGLRCKQLGNGTNIMNHFLDNGEEDFRYIVNNFEFEK
jgi:hypothetical protein